MKEEDRIQKTEETIQKLGFLSSVRCAPCSSVLVRVSSRAPCCLPPPSGGGGFTVIELLIGAFIALFIFMVGFMTINGTIRASGEATALVRATENARLFFQTLERDLSAAWPGPGPLPLIMVKSVLPVPVDASGNATYSPPQQLPIILELQQPDGTILTDALQFYTRADTHPQPDQADDPSPPERRVFVRYYVNPNEHTLCREVIAREVIINGIINPINPLPEDDVPDALKTTPHPVDKYAVCDNVRTVRFLLRRWDDTQKQFDQPLTNTTPSATPSTCTHVLVLLQMQDEYAEQRPFSNNAVLPVRTFVKVLPLPKTFAQ